jgi:hypothetical protein
MLMVCVIHFWKLLLHYFYVYGCVCLHVCVYIHAQWCVQWPWRPKTESYPLELELEMVVSCLVGAGIRSKVLFQHLKHLSSPVPYFISQHWGEGKKMVSGAHWSASLTRLLNFQANEGHVLKHSILKNNQKGWCLHICAYAPLHTHIQK